jgi:hypothetical protein
MSIHKELIRINQEALKDAQAAALSFFFCSVYTNNIVEFDLLFSNDIKKSYGMTEDDFKEPALVWQFIVTFCYDLLYSKIAVKLLRNGIFTVIVLANKKKKATMVEILDEYEQYLEPWKI